MAGNGQYSLLVANYPSGIDRTQRSIVVKGTLAPIVATASTTDIGVWINITAFSITSNVVTFTANNVLTGGGGQVINVYGAPTAFAYLNGQYTVTSATSTTIVAPLTHANVASTPVTALATVAPTYQTGGLPISLKFINLFGQQRVIGGIGPLATIKWFEAQTINGSANNFKVNLTGTTPLLLQFAGTTEASDATAVPYDTVAFRAEFTNGAF
jgi:hypothetical protein